METNEIKESYSSKDFESLGFHDCYIHGMRWVISNYSLVIDLDYIIKWIEINESYKFWVVPAELRFEFASEVKISMDWKNLPMACQIQDIYKLDFKTTPNGTICYNWNVELSNPYGSIELWSTDFQLIIRGKPVLSQLQHLR